MYFFSKGIDFRYYLIYTLVVHWVLPKIKGRCTMVKGRPKQENSKTKVLSIKIQQTLLDETKDYANKKNMSVGEVVRLALEKLIHK